jgi:GAF domain-containing protein
VSSLLIRLRSHTRPAPHPASRGPRVANSKKKDPNPLRNNLLFSQDSTSSPPYFRLQRFVWTTTLLPNFQASYFWVPSVASLLVSPLTPPPDGACADALMSRRTIIVPDVESYPGHIACDGHTKSEIVCPLILKSSGKEVGLGVFDLDCLAQGGFDEDDKTGLEKIAQLVVDACDW